MRYLLSACAAMVAVGLLAACPGTQPSNVIITTSRAPGDDCKYTSDGVYIESLTADLATASVVWGYFSWESNLQNSPVLVGSDVVTPADRNDFVAKTATLNFKSTPALNLPSETVPISATITAGGQATANYFAVPLLTSKTLAELSAQSTGATTVITTFSVSGNLVQGDALTTNERSFPVSVYNSGFAGCPADKPYALNAGLCGNNGVDVSFSTGNPADTYCTADAGTGP